MSQHLTITLQGLEMFPLLTAEERAQFIAELQGIIDKWNRIKMSSMLTHKQVSPMNGNIPEPVQEQAE